MNNIILKYKYEFLQPYSPRRKGKYWLVKPIPVWDEHPEDFKQVFAEMKKLGATMWIWQKKGFAFYQDEKPDLGMKKKQDIPPVKKKPKTGKKEQISAWRSIVDEKGKNYGLYTASDLELAAQYEGLGGLANKESEYLKTLTPEERTGILDQYYTPMKIVGQMWGLAESNGFLSHDAVRVLDPACGSGRFLRCTTSNMTVDAYEPDLYPYVAAKLLHPNLNVVQAKFDSLFYKNADHRFHIGASHLPSYDLVIGNPPYREFKSEYSKEERKATGAANYDQYFMMRGIDLLNTGGLLVYVIPSTFLANDGKYNDFKENLAKKAELLQAYRLPSGTFKNTAINTDIVVFRKR